VRIPEKSYSQTTSVHQGIVRAYLTSTAYGRAYDRIDQS
jgi:hypothetical protein